MIIKWNWGTGLFIAATLFILMIAVLVYLMYQQNFDLVENDYYPKALVYQQKLDKMNNAMQLKEKARVEILESMVMVHFPSAFHPDSISGTIQFYRPSAEADDIFISAKHNSEGIVYYSTANLMKGKYLVKIDYQYGKTGYYQEEPLLVP